MGMIVLRGSLWSLCSVGLSLPSRSHFPRHRILSSSIALQSAVPGEAVELILPSHVRKWLDLELPEGRCVGVSMSEAVAGDNCLDNDNLERKWKQKAYHPDEIVYGNTLSGAMADSFWLGRLAMRLA